jgi:hypothetical protein
MSQSDQKAVQYLGEAHASEIGLVSVLQSQIAMTPRGLLPRGVGEASGRDAQPRPLHSGVPG